LKAASFPIGGARSRRPPRNWK